MEHENAFGWGAVRCVSASTYLRLRFLDAHTVSEEVRTRGRGRRGVRLWSRAVVGQLLGGWGRRGCCRLHAASRLPPHRASSNNPPHSLVPPQLGQHLSRAEQRQLLHRRDYVLHYFDELVASQGYSATVRE